MISFSQKIGLKPIKSVLQTGSMDNDLRTALWNVLGIYYWDRFGSEFASSYTSPGYEEDRAMCKILWMWHLKLPADTMSYEWIVLYKHIRGHFLSCSWNEVYDFLQFVAVNFKCAYPHQDANADFIFACNNVLKKELSAYRIVGDDIVQITSDEEIVEIEGVLALKKLGPVQEHIKTALDHLSRKEKPDYRNSIKESISAVESICIKISGNPKAKLSDALNAIEPKMKLHPAQKIAFDKLYGYTSDADGIRHALLEEDSLDFEDAKFMLVACSAFINYLVSKGAKDGLKLS